MDNDVRTILVTGATGLVGGRTLSRMLAGRRKLRAIVIVRDAARWNAIAPAMGIDRSRVEVLVGDITLPGLGLTAAQRARLAARVSAVVHSAADTSFSQSLDDARRSNVCGTRNLLDVAASWPGGRRFACVSTAFVAGRRTGRVAERDNGAHAGFVNAYEQSKYEAESLVRLSDTRWVILRSSTIVGDSESGDVTPVNAIHRALRLYHHGLAPMLPGEESTPVDVVTTDFVARAIAELALRDDVSGATVHLCAGAGAMPLGELLDTTWARWAAADGWKRRSIARPSLTDLDTYRLFEQTVAETGDARLAKVMRSLSHFVPQLALPKHFDTTQAGALLGASAPAVRTYWPRMIDALSSGAWGAARTTA